MPSREEKRLDPPHTVPESIVTTLDEEDLDDLAPEVALVPGEGLRHQPPEELLALETEQSRPRLLRPPVTPRGAPALGLGAARAREGDTELSAEEERRAWRAERVREGAARRQHVARSRPWGE